MGEKIHNLIELYENYDACAKKFGIKYCNDMSLWILRIRKGKKTYYQNIQGNKIIDKKILEYIESLVIPPNWKEVRISPKQNNHILVIGQDVKNRKQYIYHEHWTSARHLLNSYKMIIFGSVLGNIRKHAETLRKQEKSTFEHTLGSLISVLDTTVIRVGNHAYFDENKTVGLTTLMHKHIHIKKSKVILKFKGKSHKKHEIEIKDIKTRKLIKYLSTHNKKYLFSYKLGKKKIPLVPDDLNAFLHEVGSRLISAKDFRTWHSTRIVFEEFITLTRENNMKDMSDTQKKKHILHSYDLAAEKLGNSRTMVKNSYVHGDMVETFEEEKFEKLFSKVIKTRKKIGLSKKESQLLAFLELLFKENFSY